MTPADPLTLSIDTATGLLAVALWQGGPDEGRLRAAREREMARGHGEALFGLVAEALGEAGVTPPDIGRVVTVSGPGTFTGLRIGLAAARGLALALDVPAVALTRFELIAAADVEAGGEADVRIVAIDARRGELYVQAVGPRLEPIGAPMVASPYAAALALPAGSAVAIGSGAALLAEAARAAGRDLAVRDVAQPSAGLLARLGSGREPALHPPLPLYIRAPDAKLPEPASLRGAL